MRAQFENERLCGRVTELVVTSRETTVTILWDQQMQTD
jgi:hypothetical protein